METQLARKTNQYKRDVARCRARYAKANAARKAFMASDAARFIVQRDWKRSLADMVPATRMERYRRRGLRRFVPRRNSSVRGYVSKKSNRVAKPGSP